MTLKDLSKITKKENFFINQHNSLFEGEFYNDQNEIRESELSHRANCAQDSNFTHGEELLQVRKLLSLEDRGSSAERRDTTS